MLSLFRRPAHKEVTPHALAAMLAAGEAILVDVREADEFASGHVAGALSMPLSRFQASALPAGGKPVILTCAAGRRSASPNVHASPWPDRLRPAASKGCRQSASRLRRRPMPASPSRRAASAWRTARER